MSSVVASPLEYRYLDPNQPIPDGLDKEEASCYFCRGHIYGPIQVIKEEEAETLEPHIIEQAQLPGRISWIPGLKKVLDFIKNNLGAIPVEVTSLREYDWKIDPTSIEIYRDHANPAVYHQESNSDDVQHLACLMRTAQSLCGLCQRPVSSNSLVALTNTHLNLSQLSCFKEALKACTKIGGANFLAYFLRSVSSLFCNLLTVDEIESLSQAMGLDEEEDKMAEMIPLLTLILGVAGFLLPSLELSENTQLHQKSLKNYLTIVYVSLVSMLAFYKMKDSLACASLSLHAATSIKKLKTKVVQLPSSLLSKMGDGFSALKDTVLMGA